MIIEIGKEFKHDWYGDCNPVIIDGNEVGILIHEVSDVIEINQIWIEPEYRRLGYGKAIVQYLFDLYPNKDIVGLCEPDKVAYGFWKSLGVEFNREDADWYIPFVLHC